MPRTSNIFGLEGRRAAGRKRFEMLELELKGAHVRCHRQKADDSPEDEVQREHGRESSRGERCARLEPLAHVVGVLPRCVCVEEISERGVSGKSVERERGKTEKAENRHLKELELFETAA